MRENITSQSNQNSPLSLVVVWMYSSLVYIPNPSQALSQRLNQVSPKLVHIYQSLLEQYKIQITKYKILSSVCCLGVHKNVSRHSEDFLPESNWPWGELPALF